MMGWTGGELEGGNFGMMGWTGGEMSIDVGGGDETDSEISETNNELMFSKH